MRHGWRRRPRSQSYRPQVENLESRLAPAVFHVNTLTDTIAVDLTTGQNANGQISLRSALQAANAQPGEDTIVLGPGVHDIDRAGSGDNDALSGDLDVRDDVIIRGAGPGHTHIQSKLPESLFEVFAADLHLADLYLATPGDAVTTDATGVVSTDNVGFSTSLDLTVDAVARSRALQQTPQIPANPFGTPETPRRDDSVRDASESLLSGSPGIGTADEMTSEASAAVAAPGPMTTSGMSETGTEDKKVPPANGARRGMNESGRKLSDDDPIKKLGVATDDARFPILESTTHLQSNAAVAGARSTKRSARWLLALSLGAAVTAACNFVRSARSASRPGRRQRLRRASHWHRPTHDPPRGPPVLTTWTPAHRRRAVRELIGARPNSQVGPCRFHAFQNVTSFLCLTSHRRRLE